MLGRLKEGRYGRKYTIMQRNNIKMENLTADNRKLRFKLESSRKQIKPQ